MTENHKEWRYENTLTSPDDRTETKISTLNTKIPPLTEEQLSNAMTELNISTFVERFPSVERSFADHAVDLQKIGLISFVPARGAIPNENGVYGFAKLRGNYATEEEASQRAEYLIRHVDSYHQIYHTYVGRPFPLTTSSDYSRKIDRIDLQNETTKAIGDSVKQKREKEQQDIEEIKKREEELLTDAAKEEEDLDDRYTALRVKKAQLVWTYSETEKKMSQMITLIAKAKHEINIMDAKHPELRETYLEKYTQARRKVGLPVDQSSRDTSFMKYLVEDLSLPAVDEEYEKLYSQKK